MTLPQGNDKPRGLEGLESGFNGLFRQGRGFASEKPSQVGIGEFINQQFVVKGIPCSPAAYRLSGYSDMARKGGIGRKPVFFGQSGQDKGRETIFAHLHLSVDIAQHIAYIR